MSYAVKRPLDSAADAPKTATVLDYACLFTHDLRRKQKRWQDGKLKFHTFNKRIMVYDDRGNFIGDSHWSFGDTLDVGEELQLDRGSAIVQVSDCTGSTEQDLTELLDKRAREVEKRRASAAAKSTPQRHPAAPQVGRENQMQQQQQQQQQQPFRLRQKPLSALVQSPGPLGRAAVPNRSPYEARLAEAGAEVQQSAAKRRRLSPSPPSKRGFAQNLFGTKLTLSACPAPTPRMTAPLLVAGMRSAAENGERFRSGDGVAKEGEDNDDVVMLDGPAETSKMRSEVAGAEVGPVRELPRVAEGLTHRTLDQASDIATRTEPSLPHARVGQLLSSIKPQSRQQPVEPRTTDQDRSEDSVVAPKPTTRERRTAPPPVQDNRSDGERASKQATMSDREAVGKPPEALPTSGAQELAVPYQKSGPRTALRMKARRKPGLLMVSEPAQPVRSARSPSVEAEAVDSSSGDDVLFAGRRRKRYDEREGRPGAEDTDEDEDLEHKEMEDDADEDEDDRENQGMEDDEEHVVDEKEKGKEGNDDTSDADNGGEEDEDSEQSHDDGVDSDSPQPVRGRRISSRRRQQLTDTTSEDEEGSLPPSPDSPPARRSTRKKKPVQKPAPKPAPDKPRFARMERRSVKSKEFIGYVPPAAVDLVPATWAAAANRTAMVMVQMPCAAKPSNMPVDAESEAPERDETSTDRAGKETVKVCAESTLPPEVEAIQGHDPASVPLPPAKQAAESTTTGDDAPDDDTRRDHTAVTTSTAQDTDAATKKATNTDHEAEKAPSRRIPNPATRGKKAARKEDAAGGALKQPVPMEPARPLRTSARTTTTTTTTSTSTDTTAAGPTDTAAAVAAAGVAARGPATDLPGFSRASGGAWSRHAEDLLGMTRPKGRARQG